MHRRWRLFQRPVCFVAVATIALAVSGCASRNSVSYLLEQEKVHFRTSIAKQIGATPDEMRRAFDTTPEAEEQHAKELTAMWVKKLGRSRDKAMQAYLQKIVDRLVEPLNTQDMKFQLVLVKDQQINAFTPGGGIIVVQEGLLMYCDSEGQVAAVLAHEIAHVLRHHPVKQRQIGIARKAGRSLTEAITPQSLKKSVGNLLKIGGGATVNAAIRAQEREADSIAIDILVASGYDPMEMVNVQRVFKQYAPQGSRLANML
jgi:predicted Zn-dependent protease